MADKTDTASFDVQVIIDVFNHDKTLAPRCRKVGEVLNDRMTDISRFYWNYWIEMGKFPELQNAENVELAVQRTASFITERMRNVDGFEWTKYLTRQITDSCKRGIALENVHAASARTNAYTLELLAECYDIKADDFQDLAKSIITANGLELSIMAKCYTSYHAEQNLERRREQSSQFESDIGIAAHDVADQTAVLRQQAASSSQMANGMLSKASEVAAASEQSAVAMR